jgi:hypothetical protein
MSNAMPDAVHTGPDPQSADFPDHSAKTLRPESRLDLPHAYFVEEARLRVAGSGVYHLATHPTKPEEFQSSACFDAWAKDEDAA